MIVIPEEDKRAAWQWLAQQAIAGNQHATIVLVDWSRESRAPAYPKARPFPSYEPKPLFEIAATFQWWLDADDRKPTATPGMFVIPPKLPSVRKVTEWISAIQSATADCAGTKYADALDQVARCLALLSGHIDVVDQDSLVNPPGWPTRPVLKSWISALTATPPSAGATK